MKWAKCHQVFPEIRVETKAMKASTSSTPTIWGLPTRNRLARYNTTCCDVAASLECRHLREVPTLVARCSRRSWDHRWDQSAIHRMPHSMVADSKIASKKVAGLDAAELNESRRPPFWSVSDAACISQRFGKSLQGLHMFPTFLGDAPTKKQITTVVSPKQTAPVLPRRETKHGHIARMQLSNIPWREKNILMSPVSSQLIGVSMKMFVCVYAYACVCVCAPWCRCTSCV